AAAVRVVPVLAGHTGRPHHLDTYDRILSNSRYTQRWVERLWGRESGRLHPPVGMVPPGEKAPIILSVGRFFLPGTGHNKKQLEMVEAFRRLVERGGADGWEYHLVGGCAPEHRPYLDRIRAAAAGLPVVLHVDATGAELRDLYARASIFWHAAGLGEDPGGVDHDRHRPGRHGLDRRDAEVLVAVGQVEIVDQGVTGYRFATLD